MTRHRYPQCSLSPTLPRGWEGINGARRVSALLCGGHNECCAACSFKGLPSVHIGLACGMFVCKAEAQLHALILRLSHFKVFGQTFADQLEVVIWSIELEGPGEMGSAISLRAVPASVGGFLLFGFRCLPSVGTRWVVRFWVGTVFWLVWHGAGRVSTSFCVLAVTASVVPCGYGFSNPIASLSVSTLQIHYSSSPFRID